MKPPRRRNTVLEAMLKLRRESSAINLTGSIVFFYIAENPGINITELAELAQIEVPTASRLVKSLACSEALGSGRCRAKLVEIFDNALDPRSRVVHLSEAGRALCMELESVIAEAIPIEACNDPIA